MSKKTCLCYATVLVICACAALGIWVIPNGVTKENSDRIKPGMTVWQIRFILRSPGRLGDGEHGADYWTWDGNGNSISVQVDQSTGEATWVTFCDHIPKIGKRP